MGLNKKVVNRTAQVLPHYVKEIGVVFPGLTGLFLSGLTSSALSTMSAAINTASGTFYEDFVQYWMPKGTTEATASFVMKVFVVIIGIVCILLVYVVERLGEIVQMAYSLAGATHGATFAAFALGLFFPWVNSKGVIWGMSCSVLLNTWLIVGTQLARWNHQITYLEKRFSTEGCLGNQTWFREEKNLTNYVEVGGATYITDDLNPIYAISFLYYTPLGGLSGIIVGLLVSLLTGGTNLKSLNPKLIAPGIRKILPKTKAVELNMQRNYQPVVQDVKSEVVVED